MTDVVVVDAWQGLESPCMENWKGPVSGNSTCLISDPLVAVGGALFGKRGGCWSWAMWWTSKLVLSLRLCLYSVALSWYGSEAHFNWTCLLLDAWCRYRTTGAMLPRRGNR